MGDPTAGVETVGLRRTFRTGRRRGRQREVVALEGLDLRIPPGEVHGLLGPNGAGKTTLCKILATVLLPTAGQALVRGVDVTARPAAVRSTLGLVFGGDRGLYTRLSARQNLRYWAALYHLPRREGRRRADELLERVGLAARADDRVETFSRGMKQRLHLARGLVADPQVLLLDEPATGLDPVGARGFRDAVGELRGERRTILITTHDMVEAEALCDRVTLIDRGRAIATESPETLRGWVTRFERVEVDGADPAVLEQVARLEGVAGVDVDAAGSARIETNAPGASAAVLRHLLDRGTTAVRTTRPSLEDVYVQLIGERGLEV